MSFRWTGHCSATDTATPIEALEIIRCMAVRFSDDQIASVLNRRGYSYRQREAMESDPGGHSQAT